MNRKFQAPQAFSEQPYVAIAMVAVESNQVKAIGYDAERQTLAVTFTRGPGHIYHYPNVEEQVHTDFVASESKGKFFAAHIKDLPFEKFKAPEVEAPAGQE